MIFFHKCSRLSRVNTLCTPKYLPLYFGYTPSPYDLVLFYFYVFVLIKNVLFVSVFAGELNLEFHVNSKLAM